jgi:hypothetical protein
MFVGSLYAGMLSEKAACLVQSCRARQPLSVQLVDWGVLLRCFVTVL